MRFLIHFRNAVLPSWYCFRRVHGLGFDPSNSASKPLTSPADFGALLAPPFAAWLGIAGGYRSLIFVLCWLAWTLIFIRISRKHLGRDKL
jgi:hypothetical protein